jgi:hypothetical protein
MLKRDDFTRTARNIFRAKAQRRKENPAKRGSALRLCASAREIFSRMKHFCAKPTE